MSGPKTVPAIVVDLAKGHSLSEFYPIVHPTLVTQLHRVEEALLAYGDDLAIDVAPGGLAVAGETVARRSPHVQRLGAKLVELGVREVVFQHHVPAESLGRFLSGVALPPRVIAAAGGLEAALSAAGVSRVAVNGRTITAAPITVAASGPALPVPGAGKKKEKGEFDGVALWSTHDMYQQVQLSARRVETEDLEELRKMLREGADSDRVEALQRLEYVAQWCIERGMMDRAIGVLRDLRRDSDALAKRNPSTRGSIVMAMHRIANRYIIEEIVERLGRSKSEDERAELRGVLLALGAEVVTPLVRSLVGASDLSARRAFRDALVELDRVGVPLLEDMIGDERWFVVRNMVGILGEIRSADAPEHFARTIRHPDVRVRRETIIALSKFGGDEAVQQLIVGLGDAEPSLRSAAALGLGLTKAGTAVAPLIKRLGGETDQETVIEIVRALGRIGDPRAIAALADRANGGSLFSRVPIPIRVEAIRALGDVGGEAARTVLQRLMRDRNDAVREAAIKASEGTADRPGDGNPDVA
ncbi:HEAT repeat domain-containing protein [Longimicrobium sp.]|uniref:HEAT repeat domain-containing protein n=1 Tax=Longimicrobium sp. TaxID=2029185 RepID=UPI002BAF54C4|nr:HEAT repeat domain-containing protein [Longimicrobium sp.]HSU12466.1 HEAT repeat domain-containing protein [Longimicrobium sp.]